MPAMVTVRAMLDSSQVGYAMPLLPFAQRSRMAGLLLPALLMAACGGGGPSPSGSPTGTPSTSGSPAASGTPGPTAPGSASPVGEPWPAGWQSAFCALFAETVVMQELAVDVGRALDDDADAEAEALNGELALAATSVREQLGGLPPWEAAAPFERQMVDLLHLADEMATRYARHFQTGRQAPLNAAVAAGGQMNEVVPRVLNRLDVLIEAGLACPGVDFSLETPPAP